MFSDIQNVEPLTLSHLVSSAWDFLNHSAMSLIHTVQHTHESEKEHKTSSPALAISKRATKNENTIHDEEMALNTSSPPRAPSPVEVLAHTDDVVAPAEGQRYVLYLKNRITTRSLKIFSHVCLLAVLKPNKEEDAQGATKRRKR
jgi:hypothetical protein